MTVLVLVRHGESTWNVERRVQGQGGGGLSALGHRQAQHTAGVLAALYPDALLVSSDLERCVQTAGYLADVLGREPQIEVGLRERDFGDWSGRLATELATQETERWERWRHGEDVVGEVGGEDRTALTDRVLPTLRRLAAQTDDACICVTHGGPIWHGARALLHLTEHALGGVANCSVTELELTMGHTRLLGWNQLTHLPPELRMVEPATGGTPEEEEQEDVAPD